MASDGCNRITNSIDIEIEVDTMKLSSSKNGVFNLGVPLQQTLVGLGQALVVEIAGVVLVRIGIEIVIEVGVESGGHVTTPTIHTGLVHRKHVTNHLHLLHAPGHRQAK
jgi:hypothetical protein